METEDLFGFLSSDEEKDETQQEATSENEDDGNDERGNRDDHDDGTHDLNEDAHEHDGEEINDVKESHENEEARDGSDQESQEEYECSYYETVPFPNDSEISLFIMPSFAAVEVRPWLKESAEKDESLKDGQLKFRWTYTDELDENGERKKISNARIVEWSDKSQHLVIGDEYFPLKQEGLNTAQNQVILKRPRVYRFQGFVQKRLTMRPWSNKQRYKVTEEKVKLAKTEGAQILHGVLTDTTTEKAAPTPSKKQKSVSTKYSSLTKDDLEFEHNKDVTDISKLKTSFRAKKIDIDGEDDDDEQADENDGSESDASFDDGMHLDDEERERRLKESKSLSSLSSKRLSQGR
eukprot:TRINITY_DN1228_c0_g1_i2.p1 TRINITY_DN1228_c0_g1~~TRINITY_DN1228_c0_g1_i2.p1  ORF type:complete len:350 (-),score=96.37 TRINITY_DN1228_c0_g1_i2:184-1233(-)